MEEITVSKREKTQEPSHELLLKNQLYIDQVRKINDEYFEETGKRKIFVACTFGCAMN